MRLLVGYLVKLFCLSMCYDASAWLKHLFMCERAESGRTMGIQMLEVHAEGIECNTSL